MKTCGNYHLMAAIPLCQEQYTKLTTVDGNIQQAAQIKKDKSHTINTMLVKNVYKNFLLNKINTPLK